jgi:very-short-patch-repair endonuclease
MSVFHPILNEKQLLRARRLRADSTYPERRLWSALRGGRLCKLKFRRQFAIGPFIVDYYCHAHRLAIELDGDSHIDRAEYDLDRQRYLQSQKVRAIRFGNDDVLHDLHAVLAAILMACGVDPLAPTPDQVQNQPPSPRPSPRGRGR